MDFFSYVDFCKDFGCTHLEPWNAHISEAAGDVALYAGKNPSESSVLEPPSQAFVEKITAKVEEGGMPVGAIAVDGGHIYDADAEVMTGNRERRLRWVDIAALLRAEAVRVDAGGPAEMPYDIFKQIVEGYNELIDYAGERGVSVLVENHWGPTPYPDNILRLLEAVDGLGLLFDTNNWAQGKQAEGWIKCAPLAKALHVKARYWAGDGEEMNQHIGHALQLLLKFGYDGVWGIESCPAEIDEYEGVKNSKALIEKYVKG